MSAVSVIPVVVAIAAASFTWSRRARFYIRFLILILCIAFSCILAICLLPYLKLTRRDREANRWVAATMTLLSRVLLQVDVQVEGREYLEGERPAVFLCNHQSEMDMVVMGAVFPHDTVIMAKDDVKYIPLMGLYMTIAQNVFINRGNRQSAMETMARVAKILKERKMALWIYPEGTRSYQTTNEMLPLKKGAFYLAVQDQFPIIPIVTSSYHDVYNLQHGIFESGVIRVKILPPIATTGLSSSDDVRQLLEKTQSLMEKTLVDISGPLPGYAESIKIKGH